MIFENECFISGVNKPTINLLPVSTIPAITENPGQGLIAGVVENGAKFITGVVDTGDNIHLRI